MRDDDVVRLFLGGCVGSWHDSTTISESHGAALNEGLEDARDVGRRLVGFVHHQHVTRTHRAHERGILVRDHALGDFGLDGQGLDLGGLGKRVNRESE